MKTIYFGLSLWIAISLAAIGNVEKNSTELFQSATKEFTANHFDSALDLYLKADSAFVAEGKENTPEYALSLHQTGRALFNTGNVTEGREYTRKGMELREQLFGKVNKDYIMSLNNYSLSFFMEGDYKTALNNQTEIILLCRQMNPPHPDEGMFLINLGRIYHALGEEEKAVSYAEEALPKVEKFSSNYEWILNFLGNAYMEADDNSNVKRIMILIDEHNQHELTKECNEPECHLQRAELFYSTGKPELAKDEFRAVFELPLTDAQKTEAYQKYAQFLSSQQDYAAAADYYRMASDAMIDSDGKVTQDAIALLKQAGLCYYIGKDFQNAINSHQKVIEQTDKHNFSEKLKSSSLQGLGNALCALKKYDLAIQTFQEWIDHLRNYNHTHEPEFAKAYQRLATAEKFKGDYDSSISHYKKAIELYGDLEMYDEQQEAYNALEMSLRYAGKERTDTVDPTKATLQREQKLKEVIRSSLNTLEQGGESMGKLSNAQVYATIAGSYALLGNYEEAVDYYERYISAIRPALAETFILKNSKERETVWRKELENISQMNDMLSELPENAPDLFRRLTTLIYEGQLLAKGILLSSNIEFEKILTQSGSEELASLYDQIKSNLKKIDQDRNAGKVADDDLMRLTRETDAMQLQLAREAAQYGIYTDFLNISADDVAKALNDEEAAIEFVTLNTDFLNDHDMVIAIVICKEYPAGLTVPIGFAGQIKSMLEANDLFNDSQYALAFWGNILHAIPDKKRIFFAPDGILNNIGIEYLSLNGTPMSNNLELHRLSSTREIVRDHKQEPLFYASIFGDIDYAQEGAEVTDKSKYARRESDGIIFNPLKNTAREVAEISSVLKKENQKAKIFSYTGPKASKQEFLSQKEIPVNLLHIATHGMFLDEKGLTNTDAMQRSILAFAGASLYDENEINKGVVSAVEIAEMNLSDCDLVVLSACDSGLGKLGEDGVFGLQRGFKNAGAKTLLVSLNKVADVVTADMMIAFYRHLFSNNRLTKREALNKAQEEMRAKYPDDNTWAYFILIDAFN